MEAVKQGSACVGIKSSKYVVIAAYRRYFFIYINRQPSELAGYQKKLVKISDNIGIAVAGLTADARSLSKYMRNECVNYKYTYNEPMPVSRLVRQVAASILYILLEYQNCTQTYVSRPYGVGLLVIGYDVFFYFIFRKVVHIYMKHHHQVLLLNIILMLLVLDLNLLELI